MSGDIACSFRRSYKPARLSERRAESTLARRPRRIEGSHQEVCMISVDDQRLPPPELPESRTFYTQRLERFPLRRIHLHILRE
jgi:hypothetical protein